MASRAVDGQVTTLQAYHDSYCIRAGVMSMNDSVGVLMAETPRYINEGAFPPRIHSDSNRRSFGLYHSTRTFAILVAPIP